MLNNILTALKLSGISCNSRESAQRFCEYMWILHHKVCLPVGVQVYFKEKTQSDFVFSEYYDFAYGEDEE